MGESCGANGMGRPMGRTGHFESVRVEGGGAMLLRRFYGADFEVLNLALGKLCLGVGGFTSQV